MRSAVILAVLMFVAMLSTESCFSCADDPKYTVASPSLQGFKRLVEESA